MKVKRKTPREQLIENEWKYHSAFKYSFDAILLTEPNGNILAANPAACEMFGMTEKEICKSGRAGIMNTRDPRLAAALEARRKTGHYYGELTGKRKDGTVFPIELSSSVFADSNGSQLTSMIIRDISKRVELIQALEAKEANIRSIIENADGSIWSIDRDYRLIDSNMRFRKRFADGTGKLVNNGDNVLRVLPEELKDKWKVYYDRGLAGEHFSIQAHTIKPLAPEIFNYSFNPVFNKDGVVTGLTIIGHNITKMITAESELRKNEERFRHIAESSGEWIWEVDKDGLYTYVSPLSVSLLGYTPEEILGKKHFYDFFVPEVREDLKNAAFRTFRQKKAFRKFENPNLHRDGHLVILETSGYPVFNENGDLAGYRGADTDVTEKRRTEKLLMDSEERYRMLAEQGGIGIGLYGYDGKILYFNNKALSNLGGKAEDFIGRSLTETFGEEAGNEYLRRVRLAVDTGKGCDYEDEFESPSGKYCFLSNHSPAYDSAGNIIGVQVISHDITERKKTEYELIIAERRYRTLFEKSVVPIWEEDFSEVNVIFSQLRKRKVRNFRAYFDKHPELVEKCASLVRIVDVNKTSVDFFKLNTKEELKLNLTSFFVPETFKAFKEEMITLAEGNYEFQSDLPIKTSANEIKHIHLILQVQPGHYETLSRVTVSWIDITDRVNYESNLKKTSELLRNLNRHLEEARENERSLISLNLHDDLGQKLTAIKMDLAWVRKRFGIQSDLVMMKMSSLENLLDNSIETIQKISSDLRPPVLYDLGLPSAIEWMLKERVWSAGIGVSLKIDPAEFSVDQKIEIVIFRVFQEAITNILRHSNASRVKVRLKMDETNIILQVEDNGTGMDKDIINNPKSLGFAGMRERITAFSGKFEIITGPDKGCIIKVTIPVNQSDV